MQEDKIMSYDDMYRYLSIVPCSKLKCLFDRCWKMYEDKCRVKVLHWHTKHPTKKTMLNWLSLLGSEFWTYDYKGHDVYDEDSSVMLSPFVFKFGSLEELELKLTIAGY